MGKSPDQASLTYRVAARALDGVGRLPVTRFQATGLENLADEGPQILAFSHHNSWDIPALGAVVYRHNRRPVQFMFKDELLGHVALGPFLTSLQGVPISRINPTTDQMRAAQEVVSSGGLLGMAPEGGRLNGDKIKELVPGAGSIAVKQNVEIVPVGIAGRDIARPIGPYLPRKMHVHFGKPLQPLPPEQGVSNKSRRTELGIRLQNALQEAFDTARESHPSELI